MTNQDRVYTAIGTPLGSIVELGDQGMQVHDFMKLVTQEDRVVRKAFGMLAFISQCTEYRS